MMRINKMRKYPRTKMKSPERMISSLFTTTFRKRRMIRERIRKMERKRS